MPHVVLLGDSIFDNAAYVPDRPPVIEQLRQALPAGWQATLLAVDGDYIGNVATQLQKLPPDATHLVVSAGGNDLLRVAGLMRAEARSVEEALLIMQEPRSSFREAYRAMLEALRAHDRPTAVCTVYDAVPGLGSAEQLAMASFNEVILREAFAARLPVIDLRLVCDHRSDYSHLSPIEPSMLGGAKIASAIASAVTTHDFARGRSAIYV